MKDRAMWVNTKLDISFIQKTLDYVVGEHNFTSFCKKISSDGNMVRRIDKIELSVNDDLMMIKIVGNAFLHNMIRIIIGTVVDMYKRKIDPEYIKEIFNRKDRTFSGKTAPPYGLYLNKIEYNPPLVSMEYKY